MSSTGFNMTQTILFFNFLIFALLYLFLFYLFILKIILKYIYFFIEGHNNYNFVIILHKLVTHKLKLFKKQKVENIF
jgi:hypothetical protein